MDELRGDKLKHLLYLKDLDQETVSQILDTAEHFLEHDNQPLGSENLLEHKTLANLFFEPSTRTRSSFQIAARKLGADVINIDEEHSSRAKGETLTDTIKSLEAMGVNHFVIRNKHAGIFKDLLKFIDNKSRLINAGESNISHPTQGLLDLLTIRRHKEDFKNLKTVILGDLSHSRVARSLTEGLRIMNTGEITIVSPLDYKPNMELFQGAKYTDNIETALVGADVVVTLRVQKERMDDETQFLDQSKYFKDFGLTSDRLKLCKPDVIVMHPGPMNRGVEIENSVADGPQSVITEQVTNGIATRMAVLTILERNTG
jgi:aspartate carbamoyltransferase catalytic subunit